MISQLTTLADTSIWIDYIKKGTEQQHFLSLIQTSKLIICEPVIVEIYAGLRKNEKKINLSRLYDAITLAKFLNGSSYNSMFAGNMYRKLRENGITISTNDCLIASYCINNNCILWTSDKDFLYLQKHFKINLHYTN